VTLRARWVMLRARWVTLRARWVTLRARWVMLRARWVNAKSSLGDAESSLGDAKSSLGDAESSLGDAKSSLGDAESFLTPRQDAADAAAAVATVEQRRRVSVRVQVLRRSRVQHTKHSVRTVLLVFAAKDPLYKSWERVTAQTEL
jgi:hypothetical protein